MLLNMLECTSLPPEGHLVQNVSSGEVRSPDDTVSQSTALSSSVCVCVCVQRRPQGGSQGVVGRALGAPQHPCVEHLPLPRPIPQVFKVQLKSCISCDIFLEHPRTRLSLLGLSESSC